MRRFTIAFVLAAGCGGDDGGGNNNNNNGTDGGVGSDGQTGCVRQPAAADRARHIVVSHPYLDAETRADVWEVLDLSASGAITRREPPMKFDMGRAYVGAITFTPDGEIGVVAQDDGSVGVFKIDAEGVPTVIHAKLDGAFYADDVTTGPDGTIYVLDNQWRENGGGIYKLDIDCDDNVSDGGLVAVSRLPGGLEFGSSGTAYLAAQDIGTSAMGNEAHVLGWTGAEPTVTASANLFPEDMALVGGTALGFGGSKLFVGDTSGFSSAPNSIVIADVTATGFGATARIDVEDPLAIVPDPDRDQVIVISGFGDAAFILDKPADAWRLRDAWTGAKPQLPSGAVGLTAGMMRGHVFVGELSGVRHFRFIDGGVEDLGLFLIGEELPDTVGAIGVTP